MVFRVLDASAFYAGIPFRSLDRYYTTSLIFNEVKHIKKNYDIFDVLLKTGRIIIMDPITLYKNKVIKKAKETGDINSLSDGDVSVVSLCIYVNGELITDDFSIINVSKKLGIATKPIMTSGIRREVKWVYYCPGCNNHCYLNKLCMICGNMPKKRMSFYKKSSTIPINK